MSLLLDARKKVELSLQPSDARADAGTQDRLSLDDLPASTPKKKPDESHHTPQRAANLFAAKAAPARTGGRLGIIPIAIIGGLVLTAGGGYYVWREMSPPPVQQRSPVPPPAMPIAKVAPPAAPVTQVAPATSASVNHAPVNHAPVTVAAKATSAAPATPVAATISTASTKSIFTAPAKSVSAKNKHATAGVGMEQKQSNSAPIVAAPVAPPEAPQDTAAQTINIRHAQEKDAVDPALQAAWQAYHSGDYNTAWQRYGEVLRKDAQNRDALLGMAAIAQQQSQDTLAARYYSQVLLLDPRDPVANAGMAELSGTTNAAGTESRLKFLLVQHPQSAALHFALGSLYADQSRWGDAQQAYFNAYNLEQNNAQFAFNLAVSLDHLGQNKLAAQHYQRALQLDTSDNSGFNRAQTQQRINELTAP